MVDSTSAHDEQSSTFQLGLALAGAISAGAYTAGVLDFLFQALSEWEANRGQPGVPNHRVVLKAIAGASAGAITGALGAIALARGLQPREFSDDQIADRYPDHYKTHQKFQCVLPSLYQSWVILPSMISANGKGGFLGIDDIQAKAKGKAPILRSLLNASLLDDITRAAIEPLEDQTHKPVMPPARFIAKRLHIYVTISNMRGIPFKVEFGRTSFGMQTIGDRIHYVVTDLGDCDLTEEDSWVEKDAKEASIPISVTTLPKRRGDSLDQWDLYGTSALASGAFPLGLASRRLSFAWEHYLERRYPIPIPPEVTIRPNFPQHIDTQYESFTFESLDGGLVNNNPFDYVQYALMGGPATGPTSGQAVNQAILMVAPFPEPPEFLPEGSPSPALTAVMRALFPALMNQARFRTSELAPAVDERDFSRYLITPLRRMPRTEPPLSPDDLPALERFPIASGLLGGFGGFLEEKFRAHDFQLGRRNCQQFLRNSFAVPPDNLIVGRPGRTGMQPVIPLVGSAADPIPMPRWPQIAQNDFRRLSDQMIKRIDAVAPRLLDAQTPSVKLRAALKVGWRLFLRARVIEFVRLLILADLVRHGQIEGWDAPVSLNTKIAAHGRSRDDVRAIIAELINPVFDFRTPRGIAKKTHLPTEFVDAVLLELSQQQTPAPVRAWGDDRGYTLFLRRPGFLQRTRPIRWFNRWWNTPTID
jgi:Patatin-like phospholipase